MVELKKIDFDILSELSRDSRQSFRQVAKNLGVSVSTVIKRVEELKKQGVIKKFTVQADYHKLGYEFHALVEISSVQEKLRELEDFLKKKKGVYAAYDITGEKDIAVLVRAKTQTELRDFIRNLGEMPISKRVETRIIFETVKEEMGYEG